MPKHNSVEQLLMNSPLANLLVSLVFFTGIVPGINGCRDRTAGKPSTPSEQQHMLSTSPKPTAQSVLDEKPLSILSFEGSVYELVELLRAKHGIAISFIDADMEVDTTQRIAIDLQDSDLKTVLDSVTSQIPAYRFQRINNHLVLYPNLAKYRLFMSDIHIREMERVKAAGEYCSQLKHQVPEFKDLVGPPVLGNPRHFVYSEGVSLKQQDTVLNHLVQLLGENLTVVFSIVEAKSGVPFLGFGNVGAIK